MPVRSTSMDTGWREGKSRTEQHCLKLLPREPLQIQDTRTTFMYLILSSPNVCSSPIRITQHPVDHVDTALQNVVYILLSGIQLNFSYIAIIVTIDCAGPGRGWCQTEIKCLLSVYAHDSNSHLQAYNQKYIIPWNLSGKRAIVQQL